MHNRESSGNVGMSVYVLTMGFWPTYPAVSAILPREVKLSHRKAFPHFLIAALSTTRNLHKVLSKQAYRPETTMAVYP